MLESLRNTAILAAALSLCAIGAGDARFREPSGRSTFAVALAQPGALDATNGSKIVVDTAGTLHLAHTEGGSLKYLRSVDGGASWQAGALPIFGDAIAPALAADGDGNVGLAYIVPSPATAGRGSLWYTFLIPGAGWSNPVQLASQTFLRSPSAAALDGNVHVAWSNGVSVDYAAFPTTAPPASATVEHVTVVLSCSVTHASLPSIAVARHPTTQAPVVRVAVFSDTLCSGGAATAGVQVHQRPNGAGPFVSWPGVSSTPSQVFNDQTPFAATAAPAAASVSLDANPASGQFLLVYSYRLDDTRWRTRFVRGSAQAPYVWETATDFGGDTTDAVDADVLASRLFPDRYDLGYALLGASSPAGYGPTWHRYGTWPAGAPAPTTASVKLASPSGRTPHMVEAEDWNDCIRTGIEMIHEHEDTTRPIPAYSINALLGISSPCA